MKFKTDRSVVRSIYKHVLDNVFRNVWFFLLEKGGFGLGTTQCNGVFFYKNTYIKFQLIFCE